MKKPNISIGPWEYGKNMLGEYTIKNQNDPIASTFSGRVMRTRKKEEANAKAICKAVNETYHKGIDPEAAEDMKEALIQARKEIITYLKMYGYSSVVESSLKQIEEALKKAGVTINEKAE